MKNRWLEGTPSSGPEDIRELAKEAVRNLRGKRLNEIEVMDAISDIDTFLGEHPTAGMQQLEITKEELDSWR